MSGTGGICPYPEFGRAPSLVMQVVNIIANMNDQDTIAGLQKPVAALERYPLMFDLDRRQRDI